MMIITDDINNKNSITYIPFNILDKSKKKRGFFFGTKRLKCVNSGFFNRFYPFYEDFPVVKPPNNDGHIFICGGSGSGKSSCVVIPNICRTWNNPFVAIDIKGELKREYDKQIHKRKTKVFSLTAEAGNSYDPLYFLRQESEDDLITNVKEISNSIIPIPPNIHEPFWLESARNLLTSAILYYLDIASEEMTFIDIMIAIMTTSLTELIKKIGGSDSTQAKVFINSFIDSKDLSDSKMLQSISQELTNHLNVFATDTQVIAALKPSDDSIKWGDLDTYNIFFSVPESRLEQYGGVLSMILTQLIRSLERRYDKHSIEGDDQKNLLLLLDEFPRLGKLDAITNAISTLRSKKVTICMIAQSIAQLDLIYGHQVRQVILDNCSYKMVFSVADPESQNYFSSLLGSIDVTKSNISVNYDANLSNKGFNYHTSEVREPLIPAHKLAYLKRPLLITPEGVSIIEKCPYYYRFSECSTSLYRR